MDFLPDSFLSVVDKDDTTGKTSLVRARRTGDIERVFPDAKVQVIPIGPESTANWWP